MDSIEKNKDEQFNKNDVKKNEKKMKKKCRVAWRKKVDLNIYFFISDK